jgi:hypothetical protein
MAARQGRPDLTRRVLIRKLALPVAGIARLPAVETILVPTVGSVSRLIGNG